MTWIGQSLQGFYWIVPYNKLWFSLPFYISKKIKNTKNEKNIWKYNEILYEKLNVATFGFVSVIKIFDAYFKNKMNKIINT